MTRGETELQKAEAKVFVKHGWTFLTSVSNLDLCRDRSCFRCVLADALDLLEKRFNLEEELNRESKCDPFQDSAASKTA